MENLRREIESLEIEIRMRTDENADIHEKIKEIS